MTNRKPSSLIPYSATSEYSIPKKILTNRTHKIVPLTFFHSFITQEEKETPVPVQNIPLIDTTRKNYVPRIDYISLLQTQENKEISELFN